MNGFEEAVEVGKEAEKANGGKNLEIFIAGVAEAEIPDGRKIDGRWFEEGKDIDK